MKVLNLFAPITSYLSLQSGGVTHNVTAEDEAFSPSFYPSPLGGRIHDAQWADAYERAREFVAGLTMAEKVNITTGTGWTMGQCVGNTGSIPRLDMPGLCLQDGPLGVRFADFITGFPAAITVGSTFNKELMYERGRAVALEHKAKGVDIMLGPSVGPLGLKAAGGRNWEGFGADPYLSGIGGARTVEGIQDQGIMANAKHFISNEQEHFRQVSESISRGLPISQAISSNLDDRTLHEIYAWPFADMVHAGVASVMCAYNTVNNSYACQNSHLLNNVLKEQMGFQGFVVSDWGATFSGVGAVLAGLDMDMPGSGMQKVEDHLKKAYFGSNLTMAILNGTVSYERINDMAVRIMAGFFKVGLDKTRAEIGGPNFHSFSKEDFGALFPAVPDTHHQVLNSHVEARTEFSSDIALQVATEAVILLKNENNALPLTVPGKKDIPRRISVFGVAAGPDPEGPNCQEDLGCSNGALGGGWGSGAVNFPFLITPLEAINERASKAGSIVNYYLRPGSINDLQMGARDATFSDVNIIFGLTDSGEGFLEVDGNVGDRKNTTLWHDVEPTILDAASLNKNNIVVISTIGPVNLEKFIDHPNVTAVVMTAPGGQYAGEAIAKVLFGEHNPSGRLPFTIAKEDSDYFPLLKEIPRNGRPQDNFPSGLYFDYRYFDIHKKEPRFEFGYGLSYSEFTLSKLEVVQQGTSTEKVLPPPPAFQHVPSLDTSLPPAESLEFPKDLKRVDYYTYPYIENASAVNPHGEYPYPPGYSTKQSLSPSLPGGGSGGNPALWEVLYQVSLDVTNEGPYDGGYVAQLYLGFPDSMELPTPPRQLRGFEKISLAAGETTTVEFDLHRRDISLWDTVSQSWVVLPGEYKVYGCSSSRDCAVTATFTI